MFLATKRKRDNENEPESDNERTRQRKRQKVMTDIEKHYPVLTTAMLHRAHFDTRLPPTLDTSAFTPPSTIIQIPDYGIFTVDLICAHFKSLEYQISGQQTSQYRKLFQKMSQITKATVLSGLTGFAIKSVLEKGLEAYMQLVHTSMNENVDNIRRQIPEAMMGLIASKLMIDYKNIYFSKPTLESSCLNLYKTLCKRHLKKECSGLNPYECRNLYLNELNDARIHEYLQMPFNIIAIDVKDNIQNVNQSFGIIVDLWHHCIFKIKGVAEEVGLMIAIIYEMVKLTGIYMILPKIINHLLDTIFSYQNIAHHDFKNVYGKAIRSCYLVILVSDDTYLNDFVKDCILPKYSDLNLDDKIKVHYDKLNEIEKNAGEVIPLDITLSLAELAEKNEIDLNIVSPSRSTISSSSTLVSPSRSTSSSTSVSSTPTSNFQTLLDCDKLNYQDDDLGKIERELFKDNFEKYENMEEIDKITHLLEQIPIVADFDIRHIIILLIKELCIVYKILKENDPDTLINLSQYIYKILFKQIANHFYNQLNQKILPFSKYLSRYVIIESQLKQLLQPLDNKDIEVYLNSSMEEEKTLNEILIPLPSFEKEENLKLLQSQFPNIRIKA